MKLSVCILIVVFFITGCMMHRPLMLPTVTTLNVPEQNYEILKNEEVSGSASDSTIIGLIFFGDSGLNAAYNDALSNVKGANTLVNVRVDYKLTNILYIYQSYTTVVTGFPAKIKTVKSALRIIRPLRISGGTLRLLLWIYCESFGKWDYYLWKSQKKQWW